MAIAIKRQPIWFTPTWKSNLDSELPIKMKLMRMKNSDHWMLSYHVDNVSKSNQGDKTDIPKLIEVTEQIRPILSQYVIHIENATVDGKPATISDLMDEPDLTELIWEVVAELLRMSSLDSESKKKLALPSPSSNTTPSSTGSASLVHATSGIHSGQS